MRGFKKDTPGTEAAGFVDKRSARTIDGHELLFGSDKSARRIQIFRRDKGICQICKKLTDYDSIQNVGEWRHLSNEHNNFKRCDCMEGGEWAHHSCHFAADHKGVQLGKIPEGPRKTSG